jgi:hypothetical protein
MIDWDDFWSVFWLFFWAFAFVAYLCTIVVVLGDIFRDRRLGGWGKAAWLLFLVFVPFLTVLVYLIARGPGMMKRDNGDYGRAHAASSDVDYAAPPPIKNPASEITQAKQLADAGVITQGEFDAIKNKALGNKY